MSIATIHAKLDELNAELADFFSEIAWLTTENAQLRERLASYINRVGSVAERRELDAAEAGPGETR